jgi:hypothetical protein
MTASPLTEQLKDIAKNTYLDKNLLLSDLKLLKNENEELTRKNTQSILRSNKLEAEVEGLYTEKDSLLKELDIKQKEYKQLLKKSGETELLLKEKTDEV